MSRDLILLQRSAFYQHPWLILTSKKEEILSWDIHLKMSLRALAAQTAPESPVGIWDKKRLVATSLLIGILWISLNTTKCVCMFFLHHYLPTVHIPNYLRFSNASFLCADKNAASVRKITFPSDVFFWIWKVFPVTKQLRRSSKALLPNQGLQSTGPWTSAQLLKTSKNEAANLCSPCLHRRLVSQLRDPPTTERMQAMRSDQKPKSERRRWHLVHIHKQSI